MRVKGSGAGFTGVGGAFKKPPPPVGLADGGSPTSPSRQIRAASIGYLLSMPEGGKVVLWLQKYNLLSRFCVRTKTQLAKLISVDASKVFQRLCSVPCGCCSGIVSVEAVPVRSAAIWEPQPTTYPSERRKSLQRLVFAPCGSLCCA